MMRRNPDHGMPETMTRLVHARDDYDYYAGHLDSAAEHTGYLTDDLVDDFAIDGPAEKCLERIRRSRRSGCEISAAYLNGQLEQLRARRSRDRPPWAAEARRPAEPEGRRREHEAHRRRRRRHVHRPHPRRRGGGPDHGRQGALDAGRPRPRRRRGRRRSARRPESALADVDNLLHGTTVATNIVAHAHRRRGGDDHDRGLPRHPPHRPAQEAPQLLAPAGAPVAVAPARQAAPPPDREGARHRPRRRGAYPLDEDEVRERVRELARPAWRRSPSACSTRT